MPRKGMGQKVSSVPGQTYGARTEQEEAQAVQPMAEMAPPPAPRPQPGNLGVSLTGPTNSPTQNVMAPLRERQQQPTRGPFMDMGPFYETAALLETFADSPGASAATRAIARYARNVIVLESGREQA